MAILPHHINLTANHLDNLTFGHATDEIPWSIHSSASF